MTAGKFELHQIAAPWKLGVVRSITINASSDNQIWQFLFPQSPNSTQRRRPRGAETPPPNRSTHVRIDIPAYRYSGAPNPTVEPCQCALAFQTGESHFISIKTALEKNDLGARTDGISASKRNLLGARAERKSCMPSIQCSKCKFLPAGTSYLHRRNLNVTPFQAICHGASSGAILQHSYQERSILRSVHS
jgi:hypothetical protein